MMIEKLPRFLLATLLSHPANQKISKRVELVCAGVARSGSGQGEQILGDRLVNI